MGLGLRIWENRGFGQIWGYSGFSQGKPEVFNGKVYFPKRAQGVPQGGITPRGFNPQKRALLGGFTARRGVSQFSRGLFF